MISYEFTNHMRKGNNPNENHSLQLFSLVPCMHAQTLGQTGEFTVCVGSYDIAHQPIRHHALNYSLLGVLIKLMTISN